jgi:hypothetical protein
MPGVKGKTNNPFGKPVGTKNKVPTTVKKRIVEYVEADFDKYIKDIEELEPRDRVKAFTELVKLVVPRPVGEEELEAIRGSQSATLSRLFLKDAREKDDTNT